MMGPPTLAPNVLRNKKGGVFGFIGLELRGLVEPVIRRGESRPVVNVKRAVNLVGAALGHLRNLSTGRAACVRVRIAGGHLEFFQRVEGARMAPVKAVPRSWSLLSTPSRVMLLWSLRAPFTAPARLSEALEICVLLPVKTTPVCRLRMPAGSRPSKGRSAIWSAPKACPSVASCVLTRGARAADFHGDGSAGYLHGDVQGGGSGHLELHASLFHGGEARGVHCEVVLCGRQFEKLVIALDCHSWSSG